MRSAARSDASRHHVEQDEGEEGTRSALRASVKAPIGVSASLSLRGVQSHSGQLDSDRSVPATLSPHRLVISCSAAP